MRRRRAIPMPTKEERERAKLKAAGADPLVWAMKSVDDRFPDSREKDAKTIEAEAKVEAEMEPVVSVEKVEAAQNNIVDMQVDSEEYDEDYDDDILDESDILDEPETPDTKMIDELAASKKKKDTTEKPVAKTALEPAIQPVTDGPVEIKAEDKLVMSTDDGAVTMEVTPMRQNVSGVKLEEVKKAPKEEIVQPEPKKKSPKFSKAKLNLDFKQKKMMIGFAVLTIIAVAGVCFGVIATVKQSKAVEELVNQVAANTVPNDDGEVNEEYINLKDWKIKIKIIAGLDNVSYNMITNDYAEVQIWGAKRDTSANYVPSFAKQAKNATPLGTMVRVPRYERAAAGRLIWYDDYYNYYYQGPSGVPNVSEDEMSWWVESYLLIKEMLTNADNYTTE